MTYISMHILLCHACTHMHTRKDKKPTIITTKSPSRSLYKTVGTKSFSLQNPKSLRLAMIVPQSNNNNNPNPRTDSNNTQNPSNINSGFHHLPSLCYEPTSVLDLRRSPSPVANAGLKPGKGNSVPDSELQPPNDPLEWDEQVFQNLDWDSITDLGLHDDSAPTFKPGITPSATNHLFNPAEPHVSFSDLMISHPQTFDHQTSLNHHHHNHNFNISELGTNTYNLNLNYDVSFNDFQNHHANNNSIGYDFIDDLIRVAECVDSDDSQLAEAILDRLNQRLRSNSQPVGKPVRRPLQRAALLFKEALQNLLTGSNRSVRLSSWSDIVQTIKAYKVFSVISPIPMFSHFTTNQALLEAISGSAFVHVIDFDIGLGGQYASLMRELAEKSDSLRLGPPVLRVTAVVPEDLAVESRLIRENLTQFAQELKIRFQIEFVLSRTFEVLSFKSVKLVDGEKIAVLLSSAALRRVPSAAGFLADLRRVSPAVVVFVDGEGSAEGNVGSQAASFRRSFVCGLDYFSMVMDSLEAVMVGGDWARRIEAFVLRPRVLAAVEAAATGRKTPSFREAFHVAGFRPVHLSQFADFQAECLLGKVQARGFHVAKHQAELVLCWHDRAMVATSVWRC